MVKLNLRSATEQAIQRLQREKEALERKLEELFTLQTALEAASEETLSLVTVEMEEAAESAEDTHFDRIAAFLRHGRNAPQTIAEIEKGTGIPRSSISAVLYRTHPGEFERLDLPGPGRAKGWRLSAEPERAEEDDWGVAMRLPQGGRQEGVPEDNIPF